MNKEFQSIWKGLDRHANSISKLKIVDLFSSDSNRLTCMRLEAAGLSLDLSKNLVDKKILDRLTDLALAAELPSAIRAMFEGRIINVTEKRAALHTALRAGPNSLARVNGRRIAPEIATVHARMRELTDSVRLGHWKGASGEKITDIVHIGIGGSHLGPELACEALRYSADSRLRVHFLSSVDGGQFDRIVTPLDPASTLFIIASKSFSTTETRLNAASAKSWLTTRFSEHNAIAQHFFAITNAPEHVRQFGIPEANIFPLWDWISGRYSVWSAIGLPIALKFGMKHFEMMLTGAAEMDKHFQHTPLPTNAPVLLGLIGLWNSNFLGAESYAVVPYDDRLRHLPTYLQQLEMESNGKRTTLSNHPLDIASAPVTWGGLGTNAQHTFFQLLYQGTRIIPVDFIVSMTHPAAHSEHHATLVANCFAQAEALARGSPSVEANCTPEIGSTPLYKDIPGNNPSTTISMDSLTPETLGSLIALYEHKTYVQSVIWNINAFDQGGVEAGKTIARDILEEFRSGHVDGKHDPSTSALIRRYIENRK